ncbi:MAG: chemotaxis response regulator protein-glutamate methylesterase [Chthoniobacteraceae bacterium]
MSGLLPAPARIRVLVVDDSALMRRVLMQALSACPDIEVVGFATNGVEALQKVSTIKPDVVTMDVEMPDMDGLTALDGIRKSHPGVKVIMCSSLTESGARVTVDALMRGAADYIAKPVAGVPPSESLQRLKEELGGKVRLHGTKRLAAVSALRSPSRFAPTSRAAAPTADAAGVPAVHAPVTPLRRVAALCIGSSTGGPNALAELFSSFRSPLAIPIFIVQHMPPMFTRMLAERLCRLNCGTHFVEAEQGMQVKAGEAYIAPGGFHMEVVLKGMSSQAIRLHDGPMEHSCRPSVDVLFRSISAVYGGTVVATVLTGMGADGASTSKLLGTQGAYVIAQDEPSSVVWGMPGAVVRVGAANEVLPLNLIGPRIQELIRTGGGLVGVKKQAAA